MRLRTLLMGGLPLLALASVHAQEPALPQGLDGLDDLPALSDAYEPPVAAPMDFGGFWELRAGARTRTDGDRRRASLLETRLQLRARREGETFSARLVGDLLLDTLTERQAVDLETGEGWFDLREANIALRPHDAVDLKIGRQILTWGTGDLLFINDLFPKDFRSFFLGRDVDYLKAPSDAFKASLFIDQLTIDWVYSSCFDADRYLDGRRLSFFDPAVDRSSARSARLATKIPNHCLRDDEFASRAYINVSGLELAAYGYFGFWKSPAGRDADDHRATFPALNVYGISARGPLARGIVNLELGYYDSREDRAGDDPLINNGEFRLLVGYEREVARETTVGVQFYLEQLLDHGAYRAAVPVGTPERDRQRQVLTLRVTRRALRQDLLLSLFAFYSPTDRDGYLRPKLNYRFDDRWSMEAGANLFFGDRHSTFFYQFEGGGNVYLATRYDFGG